MPYITSFLIDAMEIVQVKKYNKAVIQHEMCLIKLQWNVSNIIMWILNFLSSSDHGI